MTTWASLSSFLTGLPASHLPHPLSTDLTSLCICSTFFWCWWPRGRAGLFQGCLTPSTRAPHPLLPAHHSPNPSTQATKLHNLCGTLSLPLLYLTGPFQGPSSSDHPPPTA